MENINKTYISLVSVEAFKNLSELATSRIEGEDDAFARGLYHGMKLAYDDAMNRANSAGVHWDRDILFGKSLQSEKESSIEPEQSTSSKHLAVAQVEA